MNKKRFVALLAAVVMVLGTVPVSAATTITGDATVATDGAFTITGDATVNDVAKPDTFVVTLPTREAFDFYVDPYNLVGAATDSAVDITDEATGQGAIVVKDDALAVIQNQSNVDVVVDVNISIEATGGTLNLVTDQAAVATGTAANMFIGIVPGTKEATGAAAYVATGEAIAVDADGTTTASFLLDAATYQIYVDENGDLSYRINPNPDNLDAVAFKLGGSVNKAADWSKFTADNNGSISFEVVFDIAKATTEVRATDTALYGVVSGTAVVPYEPVAGATTKEEVKAETLYYKTTSTYWQLFNADTLTVDDSFDTENATVTVNDVEVAWGTAVAACASRIQVAKVEAALGVDELAAGDYEVVVTLADNTVYKGTITIE